GLRSKPEWGSGTPYAITLSSRGRWPAGRVRSKEAPVNKLLEPLRQVAVVGEVEEAGELALEAERHGAGRAVALLGDDHLGLAARVVHLGFPLDVFLGAELRLLVLQVVFLAI